MSVGFRVIVGGGLGRTPIIGHVIREFLPWQHLLTYLDAILRVYNRYGRRDNKYKARIKILVKDADAGRSSPAGRSRVVASEGRPVTLCRRKSIASAAHFTRPAYARAPPRASSAAVDAPDADRGIRPLGRAQRAFAPRARIRAP